MRTEAAIEHGDCLRLMAGRADATVDLVYLDPPFNTGEDWRGEAGSFTDKWEWTDESERLARALGERRDLIDAISGADGTRAYLVFMANVMREVRRVLRPSGLFWLHCDDHARAHLRLLLDLEFSPRFYVGEYVWKRTTAHGNVNGFGKVHDTLILFARDRLALSLLRRFRGRRLDDEIARHGFIDVRIGSSARERVGYPTQKPVALLEMLIEAASFPGMTMLDPMCGSGTALVAALNLRRKAIGFDASADAVRVAMERTQGRDPQDDLFAGIAA